MQSTSKRRVDVGFMCLVPLCYHLLVRPVELMSGFDRLFPDYLFVDNYQPKVISSALLVASIYLAMWWVASISFSDFAVKHLPFERHSGDLNPLRLQRVTRICTIISVVISAILILRFGSVSGMIRAVKRDRALAGFYILRQFSAIGAVGAAVLFWVPEPGSSRTTSWRVQAIAMAAANALMSFFWGTRIPAALAVLIFGLNAIAQTRKDTVSRSRRSPWKRLFVASLFFLLTVVGLRIVRDVVAHGEVSQAIDGNSVVRQIAVATNGTQFDALTLAVRDWPALYETRDGADFMVGAVAWIPRSMWPGKPTDVAPGNWFRRVYEPAKENGWPLTAIGEWYINFGYLGVAVGGFLSGAIVTAYASGRRMRRTPWDRGVDVVIGLLVFQMGVWTQAPVRFVIWLVPLGLISRYVYDQRVPTGQLTVPALSRGSGSRR
jgi:oligosaccharide repeat unit polymerase